MQNYEDGRRNAADDVIDELIGRVLEAYPAERLARIRSRSEFTWRSGHSATEYGDRISYAMLARPPEGSSGGLPVPEDASDIQREMIWQLRDMADFACVDSEYYPGFSSGLEQVTVPSMFGCVKECVDGSDHVKPVIRTPSDVYSLPPPEVREGMVCHDFLGRMAYKHRRAGGRIPVYMTDIQGPFSCAAQMWGIQDFLADLDEHPAEAHHLLGLCTDAIIAYFRDMYEVTGGTMIPIHCHPVIWVPEDCGVAVSDDFFAVVGARTAEEFSVPYLERIGAEFGGVTTHTCGNMNHLAGVMNGMRHLKALNFSSSETDVARYARESDPRVSLIVHQGWMSCCGLPVLDDLGHLRVCAQAQRETGARVFCTFPGGTPKSATPENCAEWEKAAELKIEN